MLDPQKLEGRRVYMIVWAFGSLRRLGQKRSLVHRPNQVFVLLASDDSVDDAELHQGLQRVQNDGGRVVEVPE